MGKFCEKIVTSFFKVFFEEKSSHSKENNQKDEYTLSSVFPTNQIMKEVKKYI